MIKIYQYISSNPEYINTKIDEYKKNLDKKINEVNNNFYLDYKSNF